MKIKKYFLDYDFHLEEKFFEGKVVIDLELYKKNKFLDLDSKDLEILDVKVNDIKEKFEIRKDKLRVYGSFKKKNKIELNFKGKLLEKLSGIYLSKYKEEEREKLIITTQFEPDYAKTAFPCLDHPSFKAIFQVCLNFDKNLIAISNTLPLKEEIINNKKRVLFKETPLMSTYLLYLGIGEFVFVKDKYKNVLLRVATTKGKEKGGKFALEVAKKSLAYFEKVFGEKYPLEKLDLIALPDFASGAMENWGAITFREELLLYFENLTPTTRKKVIAEVISHELAHMWFGNLVTMKWWDDLWLNESFATYLAYKAVEKNFPKFKLLKDFVIVESGGAIYRDAFMNTHPIKTKVKKPEEIEDIFDNISYNKGGAILRMIDLFLGEKNFYGGLKNYIKQFKYKNATSEDLWSSLEDYSGEEVKKIMNDFVKKRGTPIIYLKEINKNYVLEQKRFTPQKDLKEKWFIPVSLYLNNKNQKFVFKKEKINLKTKNIEKIILNKNFSDYYLVSYPEHLLPKVIFLSNEEELINLLISYRFLTFRGDISLDKFYEIFSLLEKKNIKKNIFAYLKFLEFIRDDFFRFEKKDYLKEKLKNLSEKILKVLGKEIKPYENLEIKELKLSSLFNLGYLLGEEKIKKYLLKEFEKFLKDPQKINPEIKTLSFTVAVNEKNEYLEKILAYYRKTELIEEKRKCLLAFSRIINEDKFKKFLEMLLTPEVKFNQIFVFIIGASSNKNKEKIVFSWFKENIKKLEEKGGGDKSNSVIKRVIEEILLNSGPVIKKEEIDKFIKENNLEKRFPQTLPYLKERIELERNFIKRNEN